MIVYESPHRLRALLEDMNTILVDRNVAIVRELTKKFEEIFRGTIGEAIAKFTEDEIRGEFVVVIEGMSQEKLQNLERAPWEDMSIKDHLLLYINEGFSKKDAVKTVAIERKIPKKEVYKESLSL